MSSDTTSAEQVLVLAEDGFCKVSSHDFGANHASAVVNLLLLFPRLEDKQ
jgi:hypothetical protein